MGDAKSMLQYLDSKLKRIGGESLTAAAALIPEVTSIEHISADVEHALFHALWGHVTRALDHEDFDLSNLDEVKSLEAQMAGHVLTFRLSMGWLIRAPGAPTDFPSFSETIRHSTVG